MAPVLTILLIIGLLSTGIPTAFSSDRDSDKPILLCGGEFKLETTALLKLPENSNITNCQWTIGTSWNRRVAIIFHSLLIDDRDNCTYNYVSVRDGKYKDGALMGVFCGNNLLPSLQSSDNGITVTFVRNDPMHKSELSATVISINNECVDVTQPSRDQFILNEKWHFESPCGRNFGPTESTGVIQSPCFPGAYPRSKNCVWTIEAPEATKIKLKFSHFNIEGEGKFGKEGSCNYAIVKVISMKGKIELKNHGIFCGSNIPETIISEGNSMKIVFRTSSSFNHQLNGFAAEFSHQL